MNAKKQSPEGNEPPESRDMETIHLDADAKVEIVTWGCRIRLVLLGCTPTGQFMMGLSSQSRFPEHFYRRSPN